LKAWKNDQSFEWLQEYLYYSLIFSGRSTEALKFATKFSPQIKEKIEYKNSKVNRIAFEGGYSFNPEFENLKEKNWASDAGVGSNYGEGFPLKNYHFESFDLGHQLTPGFYMNHNFTYVGINREQLIDWGRHTAFSINVAQYQYLINPYFVIRNKLNISSSLNFIWGNFTYFAGGINNNQSPFFYDVNYKYSDFIFSTSAWSAFGNFTPGAEINFANISDKKLMQLSGWITYYPFSNTKFYITPRIYFKNSESQKFGLNTVGISGGFQLGPLHFTGNYLNGDMENFIESGGYVISNFPGTSEQKFTGSIYFPTGEKYQLVFRYINQDITEKYKVYENLIESNSLEYKYIKHTLTLGLSWNF